MAPTALESLGAAVRDSGLVAPGSRGVAMVSGGADSAALTAGLVEVCGADAVAGLHLDYRLRPDSGEDRRAASELCRMVGVELEIVEPELPTQGNVQAAAREARYREAERLRLRLGADWIATGHTRSDLAETVIYRLATSPGRRALLGLPARRGAIVRPLLGLGRDRVRALAAEAGLPFRDDPTNVAPDYARNRIRHEVLPVLREIAPALEETIAETRAELADESSALEAIAEEALQQAGAGPGTGAVSLDALGDLQPAIGRLVLRRLAERVAGDPVALSRERAQSIWRLAGRPEGGDIELGSGLVAHVEQGRVRIAVAGEGPPAEARLTVPGSCRFGRWQVTAELRQSERGHPESAEIAVLDPEALGDELLVRGWREGDRMRPLGLGGSKTLQDLFTDARVPRSLRRTLPVVVARGSIAWVAGVAVGDQFKRDPERGRAVVLTARVAAP